MHAGRHDVLTLCRATWLRERHLDCVVASVVKRLAQADSVHRQQCDQHKPQHLAVSLARPYVRQVSANTSILIQALQCQEVFDRNAQARLTVRGTNIQEVFDRIILSAFRYYESLKRDYKILQAHTDSVEDI